MKPALLIFDLDGTLLDSRESILASIRHALVELGHRDLRFDEANAVRQDLAITLREAGSIAGKEFTSDDIKKFIDAYREHHNRDPRATMKIFPEVRETLSELRGNFEFAIATTKCSAQATHILEQFELKSFFAHIQGTDPGMKYKPAPDILYATLRALKRESSSAVYVGDSAHDLAAADAAGIKKIAVNYGYSLCDELSACDPHWALENFSSLRAIRSELYVALISQS